MTEFNARFGCYRYAAALTESALQGYPPVILYQTPISQKLFSQAKVCALLIALIVGSLFPDSATSQSLMPDFRTFDACDFCLAAQGISPLEVGSTGMRIDVRYLSVGSMYQDGSKISNADHELETHLTQQFTFFYSLSDRFSLSALIPVPRRHSEQLTSQGQLVVGNQFGLGDVAFLARSKVYIGHDIENTYILSLQAGAKLPTGATGGTDSQGQLLDAHVQLGTGSTDILAGASAFAANDRLAVIVNLLGSITGKGSNGHQFGNLLNYDATLRYRFWPEEYDSPQFFATFSANGEIRGHEVQNGLVDPNSGGNVVYVSPGLQMFISSALIIELSYQQPILHNLYGQQLGEDYRLLSGLQIQF